MESVEMRVKGRDRRDKRVLAPTLGRNDDTDQSSPTLRAWMRLESI